MNKDKNILLETDTPDKDVETPATDAWETWLSEWDSADEKRREIICREILQSLGDNSGDRQKLLNFIDSFRHSCFEFGIDAQHNPFMQYIPMLVEKVKTSTKEDSYVNKLVELVSSGELSKDAIRNAAKDKDHFLINPSLFYRNEKDFEYTVKVWDILTSPIRLKQFIKDTSVVNINELYENGEPGGKIKPAGSESTAMDTNTIYGVIEAWSDGNEVDDVEDKKSGKPLEYTKAQLEKIKENKHYADLSTIPDEEKWENNVVYVYFNNDMVKGQGDPDNWIDTWMIYKDGKWSKYEP